LPADVRRWLESVWYGRGRGGWLLAPLGWLFTLLAVIRRLLFALLPRGSLACPVVVVGNITVGGTGKTPLVVYLVEQLKARGVRVGVVSRGYGGTEPGPYRVKPDDDPARVGDEPCLIARRTGVAVAIGRKRLAAARLIASEVELLISDDGLQHYALPRDLEIAVIGGRGLGNGRALPAGPLREGRSRLKSVNFVVSHGNYRWPNALRMRLDPTDFVRIEDGARSVASDWARQHVHAVAGIGHPERFFATLLDLGLSLEVHPFPDHAALHAADVTFADGFQVVMTEKDAVKCRGFAGPRHWYLEVAAAFPDADAARLIDAVMALMTGDDGRSR
jgi:tetraacyldisaccharide 4'-kinase